MKSLIRLSCAAAFGLAMAAPSFAQVTWNYANTCAVSGGSSASCTVSGETLVTQAWSAASGAMYVAGTLSNQGASGIGLLSPGENPNPPQHAIDNDGYHELILLNFGSNRVTLNSIATGWSNTDTDITILGWVGGAEGPNMGTTGSMATSGAVAAGWALVKSEDLDLSGSFAANTMTTDLPVAPEFSSSWWIISSYFGAAVGDLDAGNDYFKLLSVTATCVSNTAGGACNTPPGGGGGGTIPEPGPLGLAAAALMGLAWTRRRRPAQ